MPNEATVECPGTVMLGAVQTLRTIDATKAELEQRLSTAATDLVIDCSQVEEADIAFVQLLLSARKTAEAVGASLRLTAMPAVVRDVVDRCGVGGAGIEDSFWTGGTP